MPEPDRTVQCPICDADFDPAVAGGWCTNPECGEWQYDGDIEEGDPGGVGEEAPADVELLEDTASPERLPSTPGPATNGHHAASESETSQSSAERADTPIEPAAAEAVDDQRSDAETVDPASLTPDGTTDAPMDRGDDETADREADPTPSESTDSEPPADEALTGEDEQSPDDAAPGTDRTGADEPADDQTGDAEPEAESALDEAEEESGQPSDAEPATIDCPDCGRELDADANFCLDCGADVRDLPADGPDPLDACPECGTDVDDDASFCINCGENLDAHRDGERETGSDDDSTDDEALSGDAVEALSSQSSSEASVPEGLVLSVAGRDIDVADGDRVGREIRAALIDAGRAEDEAVRIHREHVRFDREADGYYLVDLGDNPTQLNGTPLEKGDRERVEPGDELELSGVVTIAIRAR